LLVLLLKIKEFNSLDVCKYLPPVDKDSIEGIHPDDAIY
jgi:hypothetical protein